MALIKFLASPIGRWSRAIAGIILITLGLLVIQGAGGLILAMIGMVPLLAGLLDFCVFAPIFGAAFSGKMIREGK